MADYWTAQPQVKDESQLFLVLDGGGLNDLYVKWTLKIYPD